MTYTLKSSLYGSVTCELAVVCQYAKGKRGKHGCQYLLYVVLDLKVGLQQLPTHYAQRFGIESSYRLKNTCRIRTTTKNPVVRLLFVALAFVLVNLWVSLLWQFICSTHRGGRKVYHNLFKLKTMLEFLTHAVEREFPVMTAIHLPCSSQSL